MGKDNKQSRHIAPHELRVSAFPPKASKRRGRKPRDLTEVNGSIPMDPERFAKIILNTPPKTIKKR